jgi:hypothetical protein
MFETTLHQPPHQPRFGSVNPEARIVSLLLYETGTYAQQFRRSYGTEFTHNVVNQFNEQFHGGMQHFAPANLSGLATTFLKPSATVDTNRDAIGIENGWGNRHCRFMMTVEYESSIGTCFQEILTGYTAGVGASPLNGIQGTGNEPTHLNVAHDLLFFVNSTIKLQRRMEMGPQGRYERVGISSNTHVLSDNKFTSMYGANHDERMRPTDIFAIMSRSHLHKGLAGEATLAGGIYDSRTTNNKSAVLSKRANVIPSNYMARVLDNYQNAAVTNTDPHQAGGDFFQQARTLSNDGLVSQDEVLRMLGDIRQEMPSNQFTFANLLRLDPSIQGRVIGRVSGMTQRISNVHEAGQTNEWYGRDPMTVSASIISQCVPGIMADLALTRIHFKMHNQFASSGNYSAVDPMASFGRQGQQPEFVLVNARGFGNQDLGPSLFAFEQRFWFEVMREVCQDNQVPFALEVNSDLMGETVITISIDGKQFEQYVTPSFADALLTPLVTNDHQHVVKVADDFNLLINAVLTESEGMGSNNQPLFGNQF